MSHLIRCARLLRWWWYLDVRGASMHSGNETGWHPDYRCRRDWCGAVPIHARKRRNRR